MSIHPYDRTYTILYEDSVRKGSMSAITNVNHACTAFEGLLAIQLHNGNRWERAMVHRALGEFLR